MKRAVGTVLFVLAANSSCRCNDESPIAQPSEVYTPVAPEEPRPVVVDPCGPPSFPGAGTLRRSPYLQSVTTTSARIAWTTATPGSASARVHEPGSPARTVPAVDQAFPIQRTDEDLDFTAHDVTLAELRPDTLYCSN